MPVEIIVEDPRWNAGDLDRWAQAAFDSAVGHLNLGSDLECTVMACDDARIATLNASFRNKASATNVLSWPQEELAAQIPGQRPTAPTIPEIGDIAVAYETCLQEADTAGLDFGTHLTHLILHGILHLLGYDHEDEADAEVMEGLEVEILAKLGIADPYSANLGQ